MLTTTNNKVMLTSRTYDIFKKLVQIWLPASASLYFGLAAIWGLPAADKVVGTIAVLTTFLGVVLNISHSQYESSGAAYDGQLVFTQTETGASLPSLQTDATLEELVDKGSITFKVCPPEFAKVVPPGPLEPDDDV